MAKRILFQGDSITDCGRPRDNFYGMGNGYPNLVQASLGLDYPNEYEFINRGISGNRIVDLYARIKADFINLKPDYASIYIGVNDVWHEINWNNGVDTEKFEKIYTMLIEEIQTACPETKLMIIAPYVVEGPATCNTEEIPNRYERFREGVAEKAAVAKKMAEKYGLPLIELQPAFDEACDKASAKHWTGDGVHPTPCGHEIIKRLWLEAFEKIK
ncbi:MAG: SGNH/GDSL hydrolase family protein [Clostridia bacterium]|nr:SGNH/GDSL hydrolase family protein [Clostridia bacterium]